ncbi:hypothetical protein [Xanthomonas hortorum]|uniref:hypothetical protein n=1 Tax=Xanthomonas hortorum TaxID=56454 RepID=UPI0032E8649F
MSIVASRLRRYLRLPALVLLLLAVQINPIFAAIGDTHEAARGLAEHLHDRDEQVLTQDAAQDEDGQGGDFLHALMHASHCCGHLSAIPSAFALSLPLAVAASAPESGQWQARSVRIRFDIRPPIGL